MDAYSHTPSAGTADSNCLFLKGWLEVCHINLLILNKIHTVILPCTFTCWAVSLVSTCMDKECCAYSTSDCLNVLNTLHLGCNYTALNHTAYTLRSTLIVDWISSVWELCWTLWYMTFNALQSLCLFYHLAKHAYTMVSPPIDSEYLQWSNHELSSLRSYQAKGHYFHP